MAIKVMKEPAGAEQALRRGMLEAAETGALGGMMPPVEALEGPLPVFALDASAISEAVPLTKAKLVAWRYTLLDRRGEPVGFAELIPGKKMDLKLAQVGGASPARAAREALAIAEHSLTKGSPDHEARLLRFHAAYLTAIWLAPVTGSSELLVAVAPAPDGVEAGRVYAAGDILAAVRPAVARQLAHWASERKGS